MQSSFQGFLNPRPDKRGGITPSIADWSAYNTIYDWSGTAASIPASSYGTFLDIAGEGFLLFARGDTTTTAARNPNVRITVDGVPYVFDGIDAGAGSQGNALGSPIYYKNSLKIEVFNRTGASANLRCDYTYLSKVSYPSKDQTLLNATSRKMAYATNATTSDTDVVNITGSGYLLAIEFTGFHTSSGGNVSATVTVDSVIKMSDRSVHHLAIESPKQHAFTGPIRFETNLRVQHKLNGTGSTAIAKVFYVLD